MRKPTRVLIVDDSVHARQGLRTFLATWPEITIVGEATNGEDGVRLVGECRPDVVLMDLQMPVLDGVQATRLIKQQWRTVTVIMLTIYAAEQPVALTTGADIFVIKGGVSKPLLSALGMDVGNGYLHFMRTVVCATSCECH